MTKEFKKLLDEVELSFAFLNRKKLYILRLCLKMAYKQGVIDYVKSKTN